MRDTQLIIRLRHDYVVKSYFALVLISAAIGKADNLLHVDNLLDFFNLIFQEHSNSISMIICVIINAKAFHA